MMVGSKLKKAQKKSTSAKVFFKVYILTSEIFVGCVFELGPIVSFIFYMLQNKISCFSGVHVCEKSSLNVCDNHAM